jgi:hypothetical protein
MGIEIERTNQPTPETIEEWLAQGGAEAVDECWVEPDGHCEQGEPSWLLRLDLI